MATITNILWTDNITDSREVINTNFDNLNADKIEASAIANFETTTQLNARDTANRNRVNHTWTQTASTISDFNTEVSNNTDVAANTSARHTHSNKTILDNTTASFTTADETKLDWIEAGAEVNTLNDVIAWTNITIDKTDPLNPIISAAWWGGWSWDVVWPASSTNNNIVVFDWTTWKLIKDWWTTISALETSIDEKALKDLTLLASTDLNTITDNGFYCANSTCTNLPESWVKTRLRVNQDPSNSDLAMQEALTTTTLVSYVRTTANGWTTWTSWARIKANDETKALDTEVVKLAWTQTITWTKTFTNTAIIKNTTTWEAVLDLDSNLSRTRFFYRESDGTFWMYDWNNTFLRWLNDASATPNTMWITDWASSVNNSSALLSLWSTTKWFAPPRMTTAQRDAISSPLTWLIVYNTTLNTLDRYNGTDWHSFVDTWTAQTIAWVKTFSSSPIVPTPTTDYQTATKKYVDDNAWTSVKWAVFIDNFVSSAYRIIPYSDNWANLTTLAATANRLFYIPFIISWWRSFTELWVAITTASWGNKARVWVYSNVSNRPSALLIESADFSTSSTWYISQSISYTLTWGQVYWLWFMCSAGTFRAVSSTGILNLIWFLTTSTTAATHYYETIWSWWGILPTSVWTLTTWTWNVPAIYIN